MTQTNAAPEAEASILGAVLLDPVSFDQAAQVVDVSDFSDPRHVLIWLAMQERINRGLPLTLVGLAETLKTKDKLKPAGGGAYLAQLDLTEPSSAHIVHYAQTVRNKAIARRLAEAAQRVIELAQQPGLDVTALLDQATEAIYSVTAKRQRSRLYSLGEPAAEAFKAIEQRQKLKGRISGVPSGFVDLDSLTAGFQPSDLVIIAGRPSTGKTALALNVAVHAARQSCPVLVVSLEMSRRQLAERVMCALGRVDSRHVRWGRVRDDEWPQLVNAVGTASGLPIYLDDTEAQTVNQIRIAARLAQRQHQVGLVIVDYLQLMNSATVRQSRDEAVGETVKGLKAMAKELDLPVLVLAALNRDVDRRTNRRPILADLRETGATEYAADLVMFLWQEPGEAETTVNLSLDKHRNGPTGTVRLRWSKEWTRFDNLEKEHNSKESRWWG